MYRTIIGLEVHAQLLTKSKAFCGCSASYCKTPNTNICPICTGHPGTLPNLNTRMIQMGLRAGAAFSCDINPIIGFDRKHYFSPDLPKGYQITQFFSPIAENGIIEITGKTRKKKVKIKHIHLEEDAARTIHSTDTTRGEKESLLDFNRAGIGLIEIVTTPDIQCAQDAVAFFEEIRNTLIVLNICDGHLEKGSIRCDANISLKDIATGFSTRRVEIKNLNTFKNLERALMFEENSLIKELKNPLSKGSVTKDWNEKLKQTTLSRDKESEGDYRYFPEPDIPVITLSDEVIKTARENIPELPSKKLQRLMDQYSLRYEEAKMLVDERELAVLFESCMKLSETDDMKNLILRDVKRYLNEEAKSVGQTLISERKLFNLLLNVRNGKISFKTAQTILKKLFETDKTVEKIIEEENLIKITDVQSLEKIFEEIIAENFEKYEAYKYGKKELLKWFVGEMIKRTKGRSEPKLIIKIIKNRLGD